MNLAQVIIRPATKSDAVAAQDIRKGAWQARYANPESGVTRELLADKLAVLPPTHADIQHFYTMLDKPSNKNKNLVAVLKGEVIGIIFYDELDGGAGDIGVFVKDEFDGKGVGAKLLDTLIGQTSNDLEVEIFAKNPSRSFYKKHGFVEEGEVKNHYFSDDVYLPAQRLVLKRA